RHHPLPRPRRCRPAAHPDVGVPGARPERRDDSSLRQPPTTGCDMSDLPSQSTDFPAWYAEVVRRADLAEHSSVRGSMVIKPYGYAIWEPLQRALADRIKATGHDNVYLPLPMPLSIPARGAGLAEAFPPEA